MDLERAVRIAYEECDKAQADLAALQKRYDLLKFKIAAYCCKIDKLQACRDILALVTEGR